MVAGGRVFVHARVAGKEAEEVLALDAATGMLLWQSEYERTPYFSLINNGPQATPAVSLERVYSFGVTGVLCCHEAATGKRLWLADVHKDLKARCRSSASPARRWWPATRSSSASRPRGPRRGRRGGGRWSSRG